MPDLIRHPGSRWTPAFAGVTNREACLVIYNCLRNNSLYPYLLHPSLFIKKVHNRLLYPRFSCREDILSKNVSEDDMRHRIPR